MRQVRFAAPREGRGAPTGVEIAVAARLALGYPAPFPDEVEDVDGAVRLAATRTTEFAIRREVPGTPDRPTGPEDYLPEPDDEEDDAVEQASLAAFAGGGSA